jgi:hypothetical protein
VHSLFPRSTRKPAPSPNFLQGSSVALADFTSVAGLERQLDGSFTRYRYQPYSPYKRIDITPNYQSAFVNCSAAGAQPQYVGLDQIDVLLPPSLAGKGDVVIQVTVDGQAANPGHVTIK